MSDTRCHETMLDDAKACEADTLEYRDGYNAALGDCIGLLRKWFWATNKDARACEADIRKLAKI